MLRIIVSALLIAASSGVFAADAREQLETFAAGLETLAGRFEQITIDGSGEVVEEAYGTLYFAAPRRFRWNYEAPFPQEIVADGEQLWHYDASLEQVTVRAQPDASESPMLVITQPELLDRFYRIERGNDPDVLEFEPLDENGEFEYARLELRNGVPELIELSDRFGQVTRIILQNLQRNPRLEAGLFSFQPPEGVDVLEGY